MTVDREPFAVPMRLYKWTHLRVFYYRIVAVVSDRMRYLTLPVFKRYGVGYLWLREPWIDNVLDTEILAVDKEPLDWYYRRALLVFTTRLQFLFRGVRFSKWVLYSSSFFMRPLSLTLRRRQTDDKSSNS